MNKNRILTIVVLASMLINSASAQITFAPAVNIPISGTYADHLAKGDFDNNGRTDIVTVTGFNLNVNDYKLFVYLQDTAGHLSMTPVMYPYHPVYPGARAVASGDVNNDGLCDIVIGFGDSIGIFHQNFSGTLDPQVDYVCNSGNYVDAIKIYDVDGDGYKDIVTVSWFGQVVVFYTNAIGGLNRVAYPTAVGSGYDDLEVGKLDADSLVSIVQMGGQFGAPIKQVRVHSNRSVDTTITYTIGVVDNMHGVGIGDFYGTGHKQIAASYGGNPPYASLAIWQHGDTSTVADTVLNLAHLPQPVEAGQFDCSGQDQIVIMGDGKVSIIDMIRGVETFSIWCHNNALPDAIVIADVNGDGKNDIVTVNYYDGLTILLNTTIIVDDTARVVPLPTWAIDTLGTLALTGFVTNDTIPIIGGYVIATHYGHIMQYSLDTLYEQDTLWNVRSYCTGVIIASGTILHFWHGVTNWNKIDTTYITAYDTVLTETLVHDANQQKAVAVIFPNPCCEKLTVTTGGDFFATLYNSAGQKIAEQKGTNQTTFNVENLPSGNYIVIIKTDADIITKKIIKN